ncbi:hypothetical protein [Hufsiella ginkgonis]|uniref:Uncharacterized protein n=1 Tax=Hufsiella ginkgonis TaxID=2695274 RepID=A0A7K1XTH1_9SPHI|nr:hypothetical protein [Hufsiella ginkgonis]MXV14107.1 hypothetical protein [Hufsiella ginkgonis]
MKNLLSLRRENRITVVYLLALMVVFILQSYKPFPPAPADAEVVYLVIKPSLSKQLLTEIAGRLKEQHIYVDYGTLRYRNGQLVMIDISIRARVAGKPDALYRVSEHDFKTIVFYSEAGGEQTGFGKGLPAGLSKTGKKIVTENLVGLMIQGGGSRMVLGSWRSE